jgi:hypothetical protein
MRLFLVGVAMIAIWSRCSETENLSLTDEQGSLLSVAQTSGQLASGTSFRINDVVQDSATDTRGGGHGGHGHEKGNGKRGPSPIDALNLLAPTEELLAIIDAESAGDFRGLRIFGRHGATITHYDASGNEIALPVPTHGPHGMSFSGNQFPVYDSLLALIVKTVVDFGSGITHEHDSISITRAGKIITTRTGNKLNGTETITFEGYSVNGHAIEGTKTRTCTYSEDTGEGQSVSHVTGGKITFPDGTVATWNSDRERSSSIVLGANGKPESGIITTDGSTLIASSDGSVIYSHQITTPLTEDVACGKKHRGPLSGIVETHYRENTVAIDFGDGTCENNVVTITINGVVSTRTVGH